MKEKLEKAIKTVAGKITKDTGAMDALQLSQAVLNLTDALRSLNYK
jgi:hypothetical protein